MQAERHGQKELRLQPPPMGQLWGRIDQDEHTVGAWSTSPNNSRSGSCCIHSTWWRLLCTQRDHRCSIQQLHPAPRSTIKVEIFIHLSHHARNWALLDAGPCAILTTDSQRSDRFRGISMRSQAFSQQLSEGVCGN